MRRTLVKTNRKLPFHQHSDAYSYSAKQSHITVYLHCQMSVIVETPDRYFLRNASLIATHITNTIK